MVFLMETQRSLKRTNWIFIGIQACDKLTAVPWTHLWLPRLTNIVRAAQTVRFDLVMRHTTVRQQKCCWLRGSVPQDGDLDLTDVYT
jgi:hypothetical protein